jgi:gliding motility-associated-like protein
MLPNLGKGTYGVTVSSRDGCSARTEYIVEVATTIEIKITGNGRGGDNGNGFCLEDVAELTGEVKINGIPINSGDAAFLWKFAGREEPFIPGQIFYPQATEGLVELQITSGGCTVKEPFNMKVIPPPTLNFPSVTDGMVYIPKEAEYPLDIEASGFVSCVWTPSNLGLDCPKDGTVSTVYLQVPNEDYKLKLTLTNEIGCSISDSIHVLQALNIFIPSAFSPNEFSGDNSTWKFRNLEQYYDVYEVRVMVVNRGGTPVFEKKGYTNGNAWDGRRNGQDLPIGTYWYVVEFAPKNSSSGTKAFIRTGSVTITR